MPSPLIAAAQALSQGGSGGFFGKVEQMQGFADRQRARETALADKVDFNEAVHQHITKAEQDKPFAALSKKAAKVYPQWRTNPEQFREYTRAITNEQGFRSMLADPANQQLIGEDFVRILGQMYDQDPKQALKLAPTLIRERQQAARQQGAAIGQRAAKRQEAEIGRAKVAREAFQEMLGSVGAPEEGENFDQFFQRFVEENADSGLLNLPRFTTEGKVALRDFFSSKEAGAFDLSKAADVGRADARAQLRGLDEMGVDIEGLEESKDGEVYSPLSNDRANRGLDPGLVADNGVTVGLTPDGFAAPVLVSDDGTRTVFDFSKSGVPAYSKVGVDGTLTPANRSELMSDIANKVELKQIYKDSEDLADDFDTLRSSYDDLESVLISRIDKNLPFRERRKGTRKVNEFIGRLRDDALTTARWIRQGGKKDGFLSHLEVTPNADFDPLTRSRDMATFIMKLQEETQRIQALKRGLYLEEKGMPVQEGAGE